MILFLPDGLLHLACVLELDEALEDLLGCIVLRLLLGPSGSDIQLIVQRDVDDERRVVNGPGCSARLNLSPGLSLLRVARAFFGSVGAVMGPSRFFFFPPTKISGKLCGACVGTVAMSKPVQLETVLLRSDMKL